IASMIRAILTSGSMRSLRHTPDRSCAPKPGHISCQRQWRLRDLDDTVRSQADHFAVSPTSATSARSTSRIATSASDVQAGGYRREGPQPRGEASMESRPLLSNRRRGLLGGLAALGLAL